MSATSTPHIDDPPNLTGTESHACIRVRVTAPPRPDGSVVVYLPNGTAFIVDCRHVMQTCADVCPSTRATTPTAKDDASSSSSDPDSTDSELVQRAPR
jgi:hypothetical protein